MIRRAPLAALFVATGVLHFVKPQMYERIVPDVLGAEREIVYASGVAEIAGGLGLLPARSARLAGWWLVATLVAVFPANVNMALNPERFREIPEWVLWVRLPLQGVLIWWVWRAAIRPSRRA